MAYAALTIVPMTLLAFGNDLASPGPMRGFSGFFLGCILARALQGRAVALPAYSSTATLLLLAAYLHFKTGTSVDWLMFPLTAVLVATLLLETPNFMQRVFRFRTFIWLGTISYTIYMAQAAVMWTASQILRFVANKPAMTMPDGTLLAQLTPLEGVAAFVCVYATVLLASQIVYTTVEKPLREYSRKIAFSKMG